MRRGREPLQSQTTYAAVLAYDGRAFHGYARQPGYDTVEQRIRDALAHVAPKSRALVVAGRTDRGVSATGQVISFKGDRQPTTTIQDALNAVAPDRLCCLSVRVVPRRFHARASAIGRRYVYLHPDPGKTACAEKIDRLLLHLLGRHNFSAFARDTPATKTTKTLWCATARAVKGGVRFDFGADAFARKQVRVMVSTALRAAEEDAPNDALEILRASLDRRLTARPAPAEHLTLSKVLY